ncbi:unnamed protein product, partial [Polarella glacialis]
ALAALRVPKEDLRNKPVEKELLKAAKKGVRDFCLWRSCGKVEGLDSRKSLVRQFVAATQETACDENTVSQLTKSWERITEQLAGGPAPRPRGGSPARRRPRQAGAEDEAEEAPQTATAVVASNSHSHGDQDAELPAYITIPALVAPLWTLDNGGGCRSLALRSLRQLCSACRRQGWKAKPCQLMTGNPWLSWTWFYIGQSRLSTRSTKLRKF